MRLNQVPISSRWVWHRVQSDYAWVYPSGCGDALELEATMLAQLEALQDCLWQLCMPYCHRAADLDAQDMMTGPEIMRSASVFMKAAQAVSAEIMLCMLCCRHMSCALAWTKACVTLLVHCSACVQMTQMSCSEDGQAIRQLVQEAACSLTMGDFC